MALAIQVLSYVFWLPLKLLGIHAIFQAGVRRYPLVFVYSVTTFLLTVGQAPFTFSYIRGSQGHQAFERVHYASQGLTYVLILAVVLDFIYRASAGIRSRRLLRVVLVAGGLVFAGVSGLIHYDSQALLGVWMTRWTRDLNLCAAILDLALWGMLLGTRRPDSRMLLLLAGGMGIMFTGEAIGATIRDFSVPSRSYFLFFAGHTVVVLADAVFLYVWWQAFRQDARRRAVAAVPVGK